MKTSQAKRPKKSISRGDVFQLGEHILICADSTSFKLAPVVPNGWQINLVLTDPPYGVDYVNSKKAFKQFDSSHMDIANDQIQTEGTYKEFTKQWIRIAKSILATENSFYVFNSDKMIFSLKDAFDEAGVKLSQLLIWVKNTSVIGRLDYQPQHELIAYGWSGKHKFRKSKDKSVICYPKIRKNSLHPTMKPLGLLSRLILNSTKIGAIVFDPFGGSGSTLIACEQTRRKCLMIEQEQKYCRVIIERYEALTGGEAMHLTNVHNDK